MTSSPSLSNSPLDHDTAFLTLLARAGGDQDWVSTQRLIALASEQGWVINRNTVIRRLSRLSQHVRYRTDIRGVRRFRLATPLGTLNGTASRHPLLIRAGTPWTSKKELISLLRSTVEDSLFVVDQYVAEATLDVLSSLEVPIRLLTSRVGNTGSEARCLREFRDFQAEKGNQFQVRVVGKRVLHGRYLFTKGAGWSVDHSLKDLGSHAALVVPLVPDELRNQLRLEFEELYQQATPLQ